MGEALKLSDGLNEMRDAMKQQVKNELQALNENINSTLSLSEKSTANEILSQLKDQEFSELKNSHLRTTAIQMKLKELKYNVWKIDGIYGDKTLSSVRSFQANNNVENSERRDKTFDWVAGGKTMEKMLESNLKKWNEQPNAVDKKNQAPNERIEKGADGKEYKVKMITKLTELPKDDKKEYKRDNNKKLVYNFKDPKNPKMIYRFYANGQCRSPRDQKVYNSRIIINRITTRGATDQDIEWGAKIAINILKDKGEYLLNYWDKKIKSQLNINNNNKNEIYLSIRLDNQEIKTGPRNLKEFTKKWGELDIEYRKEVILPRMKSELQKNINTENIKKEAENYLRKTKRSKKDIFWTDFDDNPAKLEKINKYFSEFNQQKVNFDIEGYWYENLKLELNNRWNNHEYNKNIEIPIKEISSNWKFDSKKFNNKIRPIIEKAIEKKYSSS